LVAAVTARKNNPDKKIILVREYEKCVVPCGLPYIFNRLPAVEKDLMPDKAYEANKIDLVIGEAVKIETDNKKINLKNDEEINYEKLVIATGSSPAMIPIKGAELNGVYQIKKDIKYLESLREEIKKAKNIVIVGGGFIGVELAEELSAMESKNISPATYEPDIEQLKKLSAADLYIRIGHIPFEKTQMRRLEDLNPKMKVIDSSKGIEIYKNDPHIWMSPRLVKVQVENICLALTEMDPENKNFYEKNKNEYLVKLDDLNLELRNAFSEMTSKKILVFHPAFGYLVRDYGFEQIAIEIEGKEPSAENLAKIIDTAKKENIKTIFVQKQFSQKSAEAIAQQIGGSVVPLDPLAEDYVENLRRIGEKISSKRTQ